MRRTPVYIVCSPRPDVGKTMLSRLLTEFMLLQHGNVTAFDINLREPSLLDYLPQLTETAAIDDTFAQMALMDRLIVHDKIPKVIDLGLHAFDNFYKMVAEIGFMKEALRRQVDPVVLFIPDRTRPSSNAWSMLRSTFPNSALVPVENEHVIC
jgi:Mrp family chromosome partitioning ATPase